jgi:serine/threonine-protein kinase
MTPERWQQVKELFDAALKLDASQRAAFLDEACAGDPSLRRQVEALLASYEGAPRFLEEPAVEVAAQMMAKDQADSPVRQTIGPFRILKRLGAGGMGEVYLAEDTRLGRKVALKVLAPALVADSQSRIRFLREARLASVLDHPNICTIHEVGEADGQYFISMQYVEGETLKQVIGGRPLSLESVLSISLQVVDALRAAHEQGIIHRDIKSNNILITARGQAKVLDFGLAKLLEKEAGRAEEDLTRTGAMLGTPAYMSPEQARGVRVDHRSDIFSFGVVLYEMATGRGPFKGKSQAETMNAVINEPHTPVSEINQEVPPSLSAVIDRALAKDPGDRYQSMQEMLGDLRHVVAQTDSVRHLLSPVEVPDGVVVPYVSPRRHTWLGGLGRWTQRPAQAIFLALAAGVVLGGLALIISSFWPKSPTPPAPIKSIAVLPFKPVVEASRDEILEMGMTDTLITKLSALRYITVRPISAVRKYAGLDQDPMAAGHEQRVDAVLEGSVQKLGDRIRVTVRLANVKDGSLLWAGQFDEKMTDIFALQDSIAEKVSRALKIQMTAAEQARVYRSYTENVASYELYVQGRSHLFRYTRERTLAAVEAFEGALRFDPNNVLAHAGLAMASAQMCLRFAPEAEVQLWGERAKREAYRALELDPNLAEAHLALAAIYRHTEFDWERTIEESRRALELNPSLDLPHYYRAVAFYHLGLLELVDHEIQAGVEVNPENQVEPLRTRGITALLSGRYAEAVSLLERVQQLSDQPLTDPHLALAYYYQGELTRGEAMLVQLSHSPSAPAAARARATLASFLAARGQRAQAKELLHVVTAGAYMDHHVAYSLAAAYAQLGQRDQALYRLQQAVHLGFPCYPWYARDPLLEPLRSDPQVQRFMEELRRSWEAAKTHYAPPGR